MNYRIVDIKNYWSPVVAETLEFKAIADAENPEFNYLWEKTYGLVDEFFVKTATEYGVSRMEEILKIIPLKSSTLKERKDKILWKMNLKIPYTIRFLKNILTAIVGEENRTVDLDNDTRTLTIRIKEGLTDMNYLKNDLEKIVPVDLVLDLGVM
jgi:hypothetical protein